MPIITLTSAPDGGWTQIPEAKAVYHDGYTYFGYQAQDGGVYIRVYRHSDGAVSSAILLRDFGADPDSHRSPALLRMDDDHLLVAYSDHQGGSFHSRRSTDTLATDPMLANGFASEVTVGGTYGKTYPTLIQRLGETNDPIYNFFRRDTGSPTKLAYLKSTNHGTSWTGPTTVYVNGTASYWKIASDGDWRIDFFIAAIAPPDASSKIVHFYADDVDYHQTDGTVVSAGFPFEANDLTEVYDGAGWVTDAALVDGVPYCVISANNVGNTDSRFLHAYWDGSAWQVNEILASVGFGIVDPSPVGVLDPRSPWRVYLTRYISGHHEIWRYVSTDDGVTWHGTAVTSGSSDDNIYPAAVHPYGDFSIMYLKGDYTDYTDYDLGIRALIVDGSQVPIPPGAEVGIPDSFVVSAGPPIIFGFPIGGTEVGIPTGFIVSATGPAQVLLNVIGQDRPQMTEAFRGDGSPAEDGDALTYHPSRTPTWEEGGSGSDDQTAAEVPFTPAGTISSSNTQAAVEEVASDAASALSAHLGDASDAHDASAVSVLDSGAHFAATDVEAALAEEATAREAHVADTTDAHDASAISITDSGGYFTGTDVEAALQELGAAPSGSPADDTFVWMPLTTIDGGEPVLVWDGDDSLIPDLVPLT